MTYDIDFIKSFENFENENDMVVSFNNKEWFAIVDDIKDGPFETRDEAVVAKIKIRKNKNKEIINNLVK